MEKVNVLGTEYKVVIRSDSEDAKLARELDGYCDTSTKECVISGMEKHDPMAKGNIAEYRKSVIRHELVHAFLYESGIENCAEWACEEMVDWIAIQFPKMEKAFREASAM